MLNYFNMCIDNLRLDVTYLLQSHIAVSINNKIPGGIYRYQLPFSLLRLIVFDIFNNKIPALNSPLNNQHV